MAHMIPAGGAGVVAAPPGAMVMRAAVAAAGRADAEQARVMEQVLAALAVINGRLDALTGRLAGLEGRVVAMGEAAERRAREETARVDARFDVAVAAGARSRESIRAEIAEMAIAQNRSARKVEVLETSIAASIAAISSLLEAISHNTSAGDPLHKAVGRIGSAYNAARSSS